MCGVIVVDAGRSRSTCLRRDAYIHDHCLDNLITMLNSVNSSTVICSPTVEYLCSWEKPLVKHMAPGSLSHIICLSDLFYLPFIFRSIKPKIQKYFATLYFICGLLFKSITTFSHQHAISGAVTRKGLTTPLTCRVARCFYLCAGAVYIVFLGSPTGSITLISYLREIPTAVVVHHPFLFGEIPT